MKSSRSGPRFWVAAAMLVSAYSPLLVLLVVLGTWPSWWVKGPLLALAGAGILGTEWFFRVIVPGRNPDRKMIAQVKPRDGEALKFFSSYVIPFFVVITTPAARWGLVVYLIVLIGLYLRGDLYFSNPYLALVSGYRVYEVTTDDGQFMILLSKEYQIMSKTVVRMTMLSNYVFIEHSPRRGKEPLDAE